MGAHDHRFELDASSAFLTEGGGGPTLRETHLEFLSRRALEEGRLATRARTTRAAAAHRYLAAAYASAIAREMAVAAELEEMILGVL